MTKESRVYSYRWVVLVAYTIVAAIIAAVALGYVKRFEDAEKLVRIDKVFEPNPKNVKLYEGIFKEFKNIYKNNRQMYRRLNSGKSL